MGVKGLKTFLDRNGKTRPVKIIEEIDRWKSVNPDETPTIVVDFCSLTKDKKGKEDSICGGSGEITLNPWDNVFKNLKAAGCSLVFFSDQRIKHLEEKVIIQEQFFYRFDCYVDLYDRIENRQTLQQISDEWMKDFEETTVYPDLAVIVKRYGEFRYSMNEECDLELAQYAYRHNAVAVISNDTDFLIYEGSWQLWWTMSDDWNQLKTIEYIRKDLEQLFGLSRHQLPLFATLLGSHFTNTYKSIYDIRGIHKIREAARYVHKVGSGALSNLDIKRITETVFKYASESSDEIQRSIRSSLDWFDIHVPALKLNDELAEKFLIIKENGVDMFRPYMRNMAEVLVILNRFYDFRRGSENEISLPLIQINWVKRKSGILRQRFHDEAFEMKIWAQTDVDTTANMIHIVKPEYPNFQVPPLEDLFFENEFDTEISEIKWKILSWIMTLPEDVMCKLKLLPNDYVLITTILCTLVTNGTISVLEADGILYTEHKATDNPTEIMNGKHPTVLQSRHVRAAHIYKCVFDSVKDNFAIAGLLTPLNDKLFNFHGVYYQNLIAKLNEMTSADRDIFLSPIKEYRVYVEQEACTESS